MPICGSNKIWEELHGLAERGILVEVEHVKAQKICRNLRSSSPKMKFFLAEARAKTMQQKKRGGVRSLAACSQLPLLSKTMEGL